MQPLEMLLPLILILVAARLAGMASRRIGMPAVFGSSLAGLILGPSVLGLVQMNETLEGITYIGVLLLMFIAGLETDTPRCSRWAKHPRSARSAGSCCPSHGRHVGDGERHAGSRHPVPGGGVDGDQRPRVGAGAAGSWPTAQPGRHGDPRAAITDDVLGLLALSLVMSFVGQGEGIADDPAAGALFPIAIIVGRFALGPVVRWIARNHSEEAGIALIVAVVLFYAWSAEAWGGLAAITRRVRGRRDARSADRGKASGSVKACRFWATGCSSRSSSSPLALAPICKPSW